ncbi:MAG: hypothetical protein ACRD68_10715 [Pyrinomonadaceae bacterium]
MGEEVSIVTPGANQRALVTYSVLTGLTPLIPVPFADDLAKAYLRRRLIRALAESHNLSLDPDTLESLSEEGKSGCAGGCLAQVVLYPLKKVFRKVFYFLEWKRAVDLTSYTYHYGYLIDYALGAGVVGGASQQGRSGAEVRAAIEAACREAPIKPVESAVGAAFRQSKAALVSAAGLMEQSLKRIAGRPTEEKVSKAVGAVEEEERREIVGVIERLQSALGNIPDAHFKNLRARLHSHLGQTGSETEGAG